MQRIGEHAVVIGASMAGCWRRGCWPTRYERVTVIERDALPAGDEPRARAFRRARTATRCCRAARLCLEELLPGILARADRRRRADLRGDERDALSCSAATSSRAATAGVSSLLASRPLLEGHVRRRVRALPNVELSDRCDALGLLGDQRRPDRRRAPAAPRRRQRRRDAARRSRRGRDRPRRATARLARGARPPPPRRAAPGGRRRLRHPPSAAARRRARRRQAGAHRARGRSCRARCSCSPRSTAAGGSRPAATAATTRPTDPDGWLASPPRSPRPTSPRRSRAAEPLDDRSPRTHSRPACAAATSACAGFPAGCCRSATRSARSTRSTGRA